MAAPFRFSVGAVECVVLLDGATTVGRAGILKRYPDATAAEYEQAFRDIGLALDTAESSFNILLLRIGAELVLIDAGEGGRPAGGQLPRGLHAAGVAPEQVSHVVITHTHGDHVHGLLDAADQPVFPRATYVISAPELQFWRARIAAGAVDHDPILAMLDRQGLRAIAPDAPILPGLTAVPLPGHTPGQIGVLLESAGQRLLHLADLLHSPIQFAHPEWSASFDVDTSQSVPTRRAALGRAADESLLTLFYHLRFPGLGTVQRAGAGFRWQPLDQLAAPAERAADPPDA